MNTQQIMIFKISCILKFKKSNLKYSMNTFAVQLDDSLPISNIDFLSYVFNSISVLLFVRPSNPDECTSIIRDIKI